MKYFFATTVLAICLAQPASAYNPVLTEPTAPYEPIPIEGDLYLEQQLLGDLEGLPDLYEFSSEVAFTFTAELRQRSVAELQPFGLVLVNLSEINGAVTEVARQNIPPVEWDERRYLSLAMSLREAPVLQEELSPGTYRIEVSTPDNEGAYMLVIGEESTWEGLWSNFKAVWVTQYHFGVFPLFAFLSPYVAIPVLILLSVVVWFKRKWQTVEE